MNDQELLKEIQSLRAEVLKLTKEQRATRKDLQRILNRFELMRLERMGIATVEDYERLG